MRRMSDMAKSFRALAAAAIAGAALLAATTAARAETLADALASAYVYSGAIDQNRALLRAADEDVAIAVSSLRPILRWTGSIQTRFGESQTGVIKSSFDQWEATLGLTAQMLLYDFGATRYQIEAAKETVLATRESLVSAEQTILFAAAEAYMNVRRDTEFVALRENNVRVITQELRAAEDRFEVGEVTRTDVELAKARLASARAQKAAAEGALMRSHEAYIASVGHAPGRVYGKVAMPRLPGSLAQAKSIAERNHPDLKRIQHQVAAADLLVLRAEAAMRPTVSLGAQLSATENLENDNYSTSGRIGVDVGGPIYQGGALSAALRRQIASRDATRASLHRSRALIVQNVGNAWSFLAVAKASREASDRQIRAARIAFQGVREEATLGSRTTLDVLDAEQELLNAEANRISAIADEYTAAYRLMATMGLLTAQKLKLKVPNYDPAAYYNMVKDAPAIRTKRGQKLDRVLRALGKE